MRISKRVFKILQENIEKSFGDVNVYLFGSRVDDTKKGGDIDLAIDTDLSRADFRKKKSLLLAQLMRVDFEYDVDIVDFHTKDELLYNEIRQNFVEFST